jgi:hypothetical protein
MRIPTVTCWTSAIWRSASSSIHRVSPRGKIVIMIDAAAVEARGSFCQISSVT